MSMFDSLAVMAKYARSSNVSVSSSMKTAAERALKWHKEGKRGGTSIGLARANQIARGDNLSNSTIKRMFSFFSRHEVDKKATGFHEGEEGFPSPGRVAWDLWGGDAGFSFACKQVKQISKYARTRSAERELVRYRVIHRDGVHAPKGGCSIGGKNYLGGEYIPAHEIADGTPEERVKLRSDLDKDGRKKDALSIRTIGRSLQAGHKYEPKPGDTGTSVVSQVAAGDPTEPAPSKATTSDDRDWADVNAASEAYKTQGIRSPWFKRWFGDWEKNPQAASKVVDKKTGKPKKTVQISGQSSKVVDQEGHPILMFHGTKADFEAFDSQYDRGDNLFGKGFYFTGSKAVADGYKKLRESTIKEGERSPQVLQCYLNIKNPLNMDAEIPKVGPNGQDMRKAISDSITKILAKSKILDSPSADKDIRDRLVRVLSEIQYGLRGVQLHGLARGDTQQDLFREILQGAGIDGMTHFAMHEVDGENVKHRVYIALHPEQIKEVENQGTFDPQDKRKRYQSGRTVSRYSTTPGALPGPPPWQLPKEQFVKQVMPFATSKGSVYAHMVPHGEPAGLTFRIKSVHKGHDPNDHGLQPASHKTVYVHKDHAGEVGMWNTLQASGKRIVDSGTHLHLVSKNPKTGEHGRDGQPMPYKLKPEVGLAPVELWYPGEGQKANWYRGNHPGNTITRFLPREEAHEIFQNAAKTSMKYGRSRSQATYGRVRSGSTSTTGAPSVNPWKLPNDKFAQHVTPFQTKNGDITAHMSHPQQGHGYSSRLQAGASPGESKLKGNTNKTVYVHPEHAAHFQNFNHQDGLPGKKVIDSGTHLHLVYNHPETGFLRHMTKAFHYETSPKPGLHPVELRSPGRGLQSNTYDKGRVGSRITKILPHHEAMAAIQKAKSVQNPATQSPANNVPHAEHSSEPAHSPSAESTPSPFASKSKMLDKANYRTSPWKYNNREFDAQVTPFRTANGDIYAHDEPRSLPFGQTARIQMNSKSGPILTRGSHKTVYVHPEHAMEIHKRGSSPESRSLLDKSGHIQLVARNQSSGKYEFNGHPVPYSLHPKVGLHPIELEHDTKENKTPYRVYHVGHHITEMLPKVDVKRAFLATARDNFDKYHHHWITIPQMQEDEENIEAAKSSAKYARTAKPSSTKALKPHEPAGLEPKPKLTKEMKSKLQAHLDKAFSDREVELGRKLHKIDDQVRTVRKKHRIVTAPGREQVRAKHGVRLYVLKGQAHDIEKHLISLDRLKKNTKLKDCYIVDTLNGKRTVMPLTPVVSSNLDAVGYNSMSKTLYVRFKKASPTETSRLYKYSKVPRSAWMKVMRAQSHGSEFHKTIKLGGFSYQRLI